MSQVRRLLSAPEVARMLGRSVRTIQRMAASGQLPAEKFEGRTGAYVFDASVIEYLARQADRDSDREQPAKVRRAS